MTGVEILATDNWLCPMEPNFVAFLITTVICIVMGAFLGSKEGFALLGGFIGLALGATLGIILAIIVGTFNTDTYPVYKVTISDSVNLVEFMNKYEILDQDGKIYIIKERITDVY